MSKPTLRSWSMDEFIDALTKKHHITTPFTSAERGLALNLAQAYYFYHELGELPDRAREARSEGFDFFTAELAAFYMGIFRVQKMRGDIPELTSQATRR